MTKEEIEDLLDRFDSSVEDFRSQIYDLKNSIEIVEDRIADLTMAFNEVQDKELNEILKQGFIPGVSFMIDGKTYNFCGFTCGMRVHFTMSDGGESNTSIAVIHKLLTDNRLTILKQEEK